MYTLGIDVGITSVGWAITDENFKINDMGTRLFEELNAEENEKRREFRQSRRLKRRKNYRITKVKRLLDKYGINHTINIKNQNDILTFKLKGLEEQLTQDELVLILLHYVKTRGISYLEDALGDEDAKSDYGKQLKQNSKDIKRLGFPCKVQKERLENEKSFRGTYNVFTTSEYKKEIEQIFEINKQYHNFLTDEFIKEYIEIFESKRKYYEGPGTEKDRTNYGIYKTNGTTLDNIFDELIGKCSIYVDELRASKNSYTAEKFNLLNDLNNLKVKNEPLTTEQKEKIIQKVLTSNKPNVMNIICDICILNKKTEQTLIKGYRINKQEKPEFHKFEIYKKMSDELELKYNIDIKNIENKNLSQLNIIENIEELQNLDMYNQPFKLLDILSDELTKNESEEALTEALENLNFKYEDNKNIDIKLTPEFKEFLINFRSDNKSKYKNAWHSHSYKLMYELVYSNGITTNMHNSSKNSNQLIHDRELHKLKFENDKNQIYDQIPIDKILNDIYNPVVKKSTRQALQVINAVIDKYGTDEKGIKTIVIEMPRDDNSKTEIKRINNEQKGNKSIKDKIKKDYGEDISDKSLFKVRLWLQQDEKCIYSGKPIDIKDVINKNSKLEVDHIIPYSISDDNSMNNKVLVYREENQKKGKRTPYDWLKSDSTKWNEYKQRVTELSKAKDKINKIKFDNLLFEDDITSEDALKSFKERNLNDTRYIAKTVLNWLQNYNEVKQLGIKVKVVKGSYTSGFRTKLVKYESSLDVYKGEFVKDENKIFKLDENGKKNRNNYNHHAVDALICCLSETNLKKYVHYLEKENLIQLEDEFSLDYILKNGKDAQSIYNAKKQYNDELQNKKIQMIYEDLKNNIDNVKFSWKPDFKVNRALTDQTIYSTRKIDSVEKQGVMEDINSTKGYEDFKKIYDKVLLNEDTSILIKINGDNSNWVKAEDIVKQNQTSTNPIEQYKKNNNDDTKSIQYKIIKREDYRILAIKDIYSDEGYKDFKKIYDKDKSNTKENSLFLIRRYNDPNGKTWEKIEFALNQYAEAKNPFDEYRKQYGKLTKYSKKDSGAEITKLKYLKERLGNKLDVSHKYKPKNNKKVVLRSVKTFRTDVYFSKISNKYKLLRLNYIDFKYQNEKYILPIEIYKNKKLNLNITEDYEFMFSLYKDEFVEIKRKNEDKIKYKYLSSKEDGSKLSFKEINQRTEKAYELGIGTFETITKIKTDILGNETYVNKEKLKLNFKLDDINNKPKK